MKWHACLLVAFATLGVTTGGLGHAAPLRPERESKAEMAVIQVKGNPAESMVELIKDLYRDNAGLTVAADIVTNQIVIFAEPTLVRDIRALMHQVEERTAPMRIERELRLEDIDIIIIRGNRFGGFGPKR